MNGSKHSTTFDDNGPGIKRRGPGQICDPILQPLDENRSDSRQNIYEPVTATEASVMSGDYICLGRESALDRFLRNRLLNMNRTGLENPVQSAGSQQSDIKRHSTSSKTSTIMSSRSHIANNLIFLCTTTPSSVKSYIPKKQTSKAHAESGISESKRCYRGPIISTILCNKEKTKENIDPASQNISIRQNSDMSNSRLPSPVAAHLINNFDEAYDGTHVEEQLFDEEAEPVDFPGIDLWDGYVNIGLPTSTCVKCGSRMWNMERNNKSNKNSSPTFSLWCKNGQVQLSPEKQPPEPLRSLLYGNDMTIHFKLNHHLYNSLFVICSSGGKIDHKINNEGAPYCFKVKGQNLHFLGSMLSADGESPKFCQVYIYDTENELENRMNLIGRCRDEIDESIVEALMDTLNRHNELVRQFHTARERFKDNEHDEFRLVLLSSQSASGRPNIIGPTNEVGGLIVSTNGDSLGFRDTIVETRTKTLQRVWETDIFLCSSSIHFCSPMQMKDMVDYALRKGDRDPNYVGKAVVLPASFIEFLKWGLPHMHMSIWLHPDARPKTVAQIDALVSGEIPEKDTNPVSYADVSNYMIHGPCGVDNTYSPCMVKGRCMRHFPKRFNGNTYSDDCGFPIYRRRNTGRSIKKKGVFLDNRFVVPFNRDLLVLFQCHINLEQYLGGRYICASEAAWRIFGFDVHSRWPSVDRLPIHLPGNGYISFRTGTTLSEVVQQVDSKRTKLEAWFEANKEFPIARDFTYAEFLTYFTWLPRECIWRPRRRGDVFGRLTEVHDIDGDLLYLCMLLMWRKGSTSFDELRTVEGHVFESFKEACAVMGLLQNDSQWHKAMVENSHSSLAKQLCEMFVNILAYCSISDPLFLWNAQWKYMSNDIILLKCKESCNGNLQLPDCDIQNFALAEIEKLLNDIGKSLKDFPTMPYPPEVFLYNSGNGLIAEETGYDTEQMRRKHDENYIKLNKEQKEVYEAVVKSDEAPMQHRHGIESVDKCLRDTMAPIDPSRSSRPFDGITVVFGGDYRQTLLLIIGDGKVHSITENPGDDGLIDFEIPEQFIIRETDNPIQS
ncbi:uncharacterized protein LOC141701490 [Apium graveolens]|uniref:uncharacterized protein LOC141701490 n=1 Tax=Apium graveolens TaxID=4045 RepID=UPI003D7AC8E9